MIAAMRLFLADPAGIAFQSILVLSLVDFATGSFAAIRDGTFDMTLLAAFLRKHVLGRSAPILLMLFVGYIANAPALTAMGSVGAAAYTLELLASIKANFWPAALDTAAQKAAALLNPKPVE